jgi:hypothetical protein
MKKPVFVAVVLALALTLAAPALAQEESALATGMLERQGITTYQYGTHIVSDEASGAFYALSSDVLDLDSYVGQRVTIYGIPAPGYGSGQVEGGPPLVYVTGVEPAPFYESVPDLSVYGPVFL